MGKKSKKKKAGKLKKAALATAVAASSLAGSSWTAKHATAVEHAFRVLRAKYDAAATTDDNRKHWSGADDLSARAANSREVRQILRRRSRYEVANNSYAKGVVLTMANATIGSGPRLQVTTGLGREIDRQIERRWSEWAESVDLAGKLHTLRQSKCQDGEAFAVLRTNPVHESPIQLDVQIIEADQVTTPDASLVGDEADRTVDGIVLDEWNNPVAYHVLDQHPGDATGKLFVTARPIAARFVLHWFRCDRPGQVRAVPEITPALPLFALLRDFMLATLDAAKFAAGQTGVLATDAPPGGEAEELDPLDTFDTDRNMLTTLPAGWKLQQMVAEHPNSTMEMFTNLVLREIGRCLLIPRAVVTGDSSGYNFSSGKLDDRSFWRSIHVERRQCQRVVLNRIFRAWLADARVTPGVLPAGVPDPSTWNWTWMWDAADSIDPVKDSTAQLNRLKAGLTSPSLEAARAGEDIDDVHEAYARDLGVSVEELRAAIFRGLFGGGTMNTGENESEDDESDDENDDTDSAPARRRRPSLQPSRN